MNIKYDVIVVGAGAAGLMAAIEAGKHGRSVLLLESTNKIAEKIRISGGGRCNFTNINATHANYISENPHFIKSALAKYSQHDFIKLVESYNITYHEKTLGQLFCDRSSEQIINMLLAECKKYNDTDLHPILDFSFVFSSMIGLVVLTILYVLKKELDGILKTVK